MTHQTWATAMAAALYGPHGFYRQNSPEGHFRTSANTSPMLAESLIELVTALDAALGRPPRFDVIDVGTGDGRLLGDLCALLPDDLVRRLAPLGVEVRPRPTDLPNMVGWTDTLPTSVTGLVIAHEYLDNVPCDVLQAAEGGGLRLLTVDSTSGEEVSALPLTKQQQAWIDVWWPVSEPGDRAELGIERDAAWSKIVSVLDRGVSLAIDYGHVASERAVGAYAQGTLTGYRDGHQVVPLPDGSCDITAHVAIDACAASGTAAGAETTTLLRQADALRALGLKAGRPPLELAHRDPHAYVEALSRASQAAELLDPSALGSFWWLLQSKGCGMEFDWLDGSALGLPGAT
ncbi:MAG: SAM-dependent methyltransferase [Actinomycetes bacterium]